MKRLFRISAFNDIKFRKKILIVYVLCAFLPIILISCIYCLSMISKIRDANLKEAQFDVYKSCVSIENIIDKAWLLSELCYYDYDLNNSLMMQEGNTQDFIDNAKNIDGIQSYLTLYDMLESCKIYSYNEKLYKSHVLYPMSLLPKDTNWYNQFIDTNSEYSVISYYDNEQDETKISLIRLLDTDENNKDILKIDISRNALAKELENNTNKMYLVDAAYNCIVSPEANVKKITPSKNAIERDLGTFSGYKIYCENNSDWTRGLIQELLQFFAILFIILLISLVVGYEITYSMVEKLNELTDATAKIQNGKFEKIDAAGAGKDEMGMLVNGFNAAVDKINTLINEVYKERIKSIESEKEKRTVEYMALVNQVNPHFMFNSLDMLRMHSLKRGDRELAKVIGSMSVMMRKLIEWKKDIITFENEMAFIDAFIELSRFNLEDNVSIDIQIDERISKCCIPKMSVQVFVENAFRHGLDEMEDNRSFKMYAGCENERIVIKICDNGCGIEKELVEAMNNRDVAYLNTRGVGIGSAYTRMKLYFGDDFSISAVSIPLEKTEITMNLPMRFEK
ncbi:MAG: histidine kinase [Clostridiales bacterium]|nr:histidine kinase [Clostridiales bacterium]